MSDEEKPPKITRSLEDIKGFKPSKSVSDFFNKDSDWHKNIIGKVTPPILDTSPLDRMREMEHAKEKKKWDYNEEMKEYARLSANASMKSANEAEKAKFWSIVSVTVVVLIFLINLILNHWDIFKKALGN